MNLKKLSKAAILLLVTLVLASCSMALVPQTFDTFDIHTPDQASYLAAVDFSSPHKYGAKGTAENSHPLSPVFSWSCKGGLKAKSCTLFVADNPQMEDALQYIVNPDDTTFTCVMNLMANTSYWWKLEVTAQDGNVISTEPSCFTTLSGPRNLEIDGITNVRDMGGYATSDGKVVKQGLIFRTGCYNEKYTTNLTITETGLEQMRNLGIRTEIDLRGDKNTSVNQLYANGYPTDGSIAMESPLGSDVNYVFVPTKWNNLLMSDETGRIMVRRVFEVLSDPSNYPVAFHCTIGTDRTGACAFLIGCALGMSDTDLIHDYLFSNFASIGGNRTMTDFTNAMRPIISMPGDTYAKKGVNYLLDIGVSETQIQALRAIMLETLD